jgi:hypothetical protein
MTQLGDNVATRELHMLAIRGGSLYHSMASNFGPSTDGNGKVTNRFLTSSSWGDVGQALGGGYGTITSAAIVAQPTSVHVFFVAESRGRSRLWHAVRTSPSGAWDPPVDVLARSGDAPGGSVYSFKVSAGVCPKFGAAVWDSQTTEILIALLGGSNPYEIPVIRYDMNGAYSAWRSLPDLPKDKLNYSFIPTNVVITVRPFRDDAVPPELPSLSRTRG